MNFEKLLTVQEVANRCGLKDQRIWSLVRQKLLPCVRFGGKQLRFSPQAIEKFIAEGGTQKLEEKENEY